MPISAGLPTLSLTAYNGYTWPVGVETTSYRVTPKFDGARRTVSYCTFEIGLRWYISADGDPTTSEQVRDMQAKLMATGGVLNYTSRGTWPELVASGGARDVAFGPHPGPLSLTPHGGGQVQKVEWSVSFGLPVCRDAVFDGLLEWNYGVGVSYDKDHVESRSVSGHVVVANNRQYPGARRIARSADEYREKVEVPPAPNFQVTSRNYRLSPDKSRMDYEIGWGETGPNAPGPGITSAEASESIANEGSSNFVRHLRTIRASYTVAAGKSVSVAWDAFFALVKDRVRELRLRNPRTAVMPVSFSAEDPDLYAPRQRVQMSITLRAVNIGVAQMLMQSGLWRPVPNSAWRLWETSTRSVLGPRGALNLKFDIGSDAIIDGCQRTPIPTSGGGSSSSTSPFDAILRGSQGGFGSSPSSETLRTIGDLTGAPRPESSWMLYEAYTEYITDPGTTVVKTLPAKPLSAEDWDKSAPWDVGKGKLPVGGNVPGKPPFPVPKDADTFIQQRVTPTYYVRLYGRAARYAYPIPEPTITEVGGRPVYPVKMPGRLGNSFTMGSTTNSGQPGYAAVWDKLYVIPDPLMFAELRNQLFEGELRGG